ncbi:MAG TPA: hypothetical protein VJQ46_09445 [Gemmatimonadales bacterium]|nr:hypothetical protein [Gemmatimonadales bacterium]
MVSVLGLLVVAGCNGDPTDSLRGGASKLNASPSQLFIELDETKTVEVGAVDAQGNPMSFNYEVTSVGSGITVSRDSTFLPVFVNDSQLSAPAEAPTFRFKVTGTAYGATSFTVSAGGVDQVIPVQVTPVVGLAGTFTPSATPALGDTITLTAPAGVTFTQTAALTLPGAPDSLNPLIVDRDPGGTFIRFLAPPNVNAPVTVTEVVSTSAPTLVLHPATTTLLQTPLIDSVDVTYSTVTPTLGQAVTATIQNPLIKFNPNVASTGLVRYGINFVGQLPGPLLGPDTTHLRLGSGPQGVVVAPDSNSLTFQAPPNANGVATVVSFVFPGGFSLTLPTRTGITSPNIGTTLNAAFSDSVLDILQPVTITAPAGFTFANDVDSVTVSISGKTALNQSIGGGGSSITVIPLPGSVGPAEITGIHPSAPQFNLTMTTVHGVEVPSVTGQEGTEDVSTAPSLTVPTAGNSFTLSDAGGFAGDGSACCFGAPVRWYKLTIAAPTTLTFTLDWFEGQDLGVYITTDGVSAAIDAGDNGGEGPGGHPETVTHAFTPGTYFIAIPNFSATNPNIFQLTIHNP